MRERGVTSKAGRKEVVWDKPCLVQVGAGGGGTNPSLPNRDPKRSQTPQQRAAEPLGCCLGGGCRGWQDQAVSHEAAGVWDNVFPVNLPHHLPQKSQWKLRNPGDSLRHSTTPEVLAGGSESSPEFPAARPGSK